jgi:hypothetical protein
MVINEGYHRPTRTMKLFEVILNNNFAFPAYTLQVKTEKQAMKIAMKEAKFNANDSVTVIEVDENEEMVEGGYYESEHL